MKIKTEQEFVAEINSEIKKLLRWTVQSFVFAFALLVLAYINGYKWLLIFSGLNAFGAVYFWVVRNNLIQMLYDFYARKQVFEEFLRNLTDNDK